MIGNLLKFYYLNINLPYSEHYLNIKQQEISEQGFEILESGETFQPIKFFDTGALVWFAKIIEWEFPNFSVKSHLDNLYRIQEIIEANGAVEGRIHKFFIVSKKIWNSKNQKYRKLEKLLKDKRDWKGGKNNESYK